MPGTHIMTAMVMGFLPAAANIHRYVITVRAINKMKNNLISLLISLFIASPFARLKVPARLLVRLLLDARDEFLAVFARRVQLH